ncbi:hypothetical protein [Primorskyibacter marinus]|uniref:hypothetical protein n=1 Tax=Primorskyibacter marinus TaxID=1977320 RepID=UPI000E303807|nr:hypothetical protein [Primorskyibacter marinus]
MKAARRPLFFYNVAMWLLSLVITVFLIELGGLVLSDLPTAGQPVSKLEFVDTQALETTEEEIDKLELSMQSTENDIEDAKFVLESRRLDYQTQRSNFESWIRTRGATGLTEQNQQVVDRVEAIELLKTQERDAQQAVQSLEQQQVETNRMLQSLRVQRDQIFDAATAPYEKARQNEILKVFLYRLALTLPLLLISIWLFVKKRGTTYWPVYRSFVMFSLFAFFVELVPYLPSYGGYVRTGVGIVLSLLFAHFAVKGMGRYIQNKKNEEEKPEAEKRKTIEYEQAVKKISEGVCPSCDRHFQPKVTGKKSGSVEAHVDYCVHCGFCLFDKCGQCGTRENSFYKFCGSCGCPSDTEPANA